jgi:2-methylisocitrate lyase-like PEP mutase family enzyme
MYREAGADVLFVEAPQSEQEVAQVAIELADAPLLFNFAEGGKTPPVSLDRLWELGYRIVIFPIGALLAATTAVRKLASEIRAHGTPAGLLSGMISFTEFNQMIGLSEIQQLERRFSSGTS